MQARWALAGAVATLCASATAQAPDVRVKLDAVASLRYEKDGPTFFRFYDPLGQRGVLAITFFLEPGFRTYVTQRLQQIENDPDTEPLDQYYVEDEGLWRVGKQYLPFGSGQVLRESVLAVRGDTNLIFEGLPVVLAACDGGPGMQRGFVGRLGSRIGFSLAVGHHFGIASTALDLVRRPEDSPGVDRGYERVFGFDASRKVGSVVVRGEVVALRRGETPLDVDEDVIDGSLGYRAGRDVTLGFGITRSTAQATTFVRLTSSIAVDRHTSIEPFVRFANGRLYDAAITLRVRL